MRTLDRIVVDAPINRVFAVACQVERWPEFLPHYRWVRMLERTRTGGIVHMAAWRPFGLLKYPTWWVSQMEIVPHAHVIHYRHVRGITRGMDVEWRLDRQVDQTNVCIEHAWDGPGWPLLGRLTADKVIGPVFIHNIALRTLAGVKQEAERS